jgi:hypothetical protein
LILDAHQIAFKNIDLTPNKGPVIMMDECFDVSVDGVKSFIMSYIAIAIIQLVVIMLIINSKASNMERHTWIFDYSTKNWTNITPQNMFGVRIEHDGMVYLEDEHVFVQTKLLRRN